MDADPCLDRVDVRSKNLGGGVVQLHHHLGSMWADGFIRRFAGIPATNVNKLKYMGIHNLWMGDDWTNAASQATALAGCTVVGKDPRRNMVGFHVWSVRNQTYVDAEGKKGDRGWECRVFYQCVEELCVL